MGLSWFEVCIWPRTYIIILKLLIFDYNNVRIFENRHFTLLNLYINELFYSAQHWEVTQRTMRLISFFLLFSQHFMVSSISEADFDSVFKEAMHGTEIQVSYAFLSVIWLFVSGDRQGMRRHMSYDNSDSVQNVYMLANQFGQM